MFIKLLHAVKVHLTCYNLCLLYAPITLLMYTLLVSGWNPFCLYDRCSSSYVFGDALEASFRNLDTWCYYDLTIVLHWLAADWRFESYFPHILKVLCRDEIRWNGGHFNTGNYFNVPWIYLPIFYLWHEALSCWNWPPVDINWGQLQHLNCPI